VSRPMANLKSLIATRLGREANKALENAGEAFQMKNEEQTTVVGNTKLVRKFHMRLPILC
jgi:hypothetical protein